MASNDAKTMSTVLGFINFYKTGLKKSMTLKKEEHNAARNV
jgi:hypothetical protein